MAQRENHIHCGLHFDRLSVEQIRTIAPVLHRIQSGLLQHRLTAGHAQVLDLPGLGDGGF